MIELKNKEGSESQYEIYIDGEFCEDSYAESSYSLQDEKAVEYFSDSSASTSKLARQKISDFLPFEYIYLGYFFEWSEMYNDVSILQKSLNNLEINLKFRPDLVGWKRDYSFIEYFELLENERGKRDESGKSLIFDIEDGKFWLAFETTKLDISPIELIRPYENLLKKIFNDVSFALNLSHQTNDLNLSFNFPKNLKIPCEQYLSYFVQFLQDLGIKATSDFKREEAGKVLFSVTPTDDVEALDKIREALEIYLRLPSSPLISSQEIEIQKLEAQVEFFRSQIRLARAEMQLKEATIQQQQLTIMKLGENVLIDSMVKDVTPKTSDTQGEILGGSVKLRTPKKFEDYGIEKIDLKKLWDYFKDKFKKTD